MLKNNAADNGILETQLFWQEQFQKFGHTGWHDDVVYAYDQQYRLRSFENWLDANFVGCGRAFDFGCGSGDFSRVLLEKGWSVTGYDPFVTPRLEHERFIFCSELDGVKNMRASFDLVLSVTVLGHVFDDAEFQECLVNIRELLKADGFFYLVEYTVDQPMQSYARRTDAAVRGGSYQVFRPYIDWKESLHEAHFDLIEAKPMFHPVEAVIESYERYQHNLLTRLVAKVFARERTKKIKRLLLQGLAHRFYLNAASLKIPKKSPFKMMIFKKV